MYESVLFTEIRNKATELKCELFAVNGVQDHIHVALSIPPNVAVAACVGQMKGASSRAMNSNYVFDTRFRWQKSYGVMSFGEKELPRVIEYIANQKQRHASQRLNTYLERIE